MAEENEPSEVSGSVADAEFDAQSDESDEHTLLAEILACRKRRTKNRNDLEVEDHVRAELRTKRRHEPVATLNSDVVEDIAHEVATPLNEPDDFDESGFSDSGSTSSDHDDD